MSETLGARVRILDAAEQLFASHGFDATATSTIAKFAAVPKGLLFYYFPAKADLLRALAAERLGLGPINTAEIVEPGDPARSLLNLTDRIREIQGGSEALRVILWREQRAHPEVKANLLEHHGQLRILIERVLRGSLPRPVPATRVRAAAQAWVAVLTMRPFAEQADGESEESATELAELAELICDGLVRRRPASRRASQE